MRIFCSIVAVLFVTSGTLTGCDDSKRAKQIAQDAANCKRPSQDDIRIVFRQLKREGANISESETGELLYLVCDVRVEQDPTRRAQLQKRYREIVFKSQTVKSISGLLID